MNRTFILLASMLSTLIAFCCCAWLGVRAVDRLRTSQERQFTEGLQLELELVTKTLRNDLVFGNLRVVRGSLAELAEGGIFSGYTVRRDGVKVLESNPPAAEYRGFETKISVRFSEKPTDKAEWGNVTYFTPSKRFEAASSRLRNELLVSASLAAAIVLGVVASLFIALSKSIGLLQPLLTSVVLQEHLPHIGKGSRFVWAPAIAQLEALATRLGERRQEAEQAQAAAMHTRIAQNLVHDLRTPLGSFECGLQANDWTSFVAARPLMERALGRLHTMVEALRHSELERIVRPEPCSLSLAHLMDEVTPLAASRQVNLSGDTSVLECFLDQPKVERAILNLLRNAIESGGARVELSCESKGSDLAVVVVDDGPGVPEELRPQLFQRGWTHAKPGGSGLGLAYAQDVARGHAGDLTYSRIGELTRFCLLLPETLRMPTLEHFEGIKRSPEARDSPTTLLLLLDNGPLREAALEAARRLWNGPVAETAPVDSHEVAATYATLDRFDEMTGRIPPGTPVVFAKPSDNADAIIARLAARAKKGPA